MTEDKNIPPKKSLVKLTWPIFVDLLLVFSVTAVDAWFLSRISDAVAASVGAVLPLIGLGITFFITTSYAGTSIASQRIGAGDTQSLAFTYGALFQIFLVLGSCVSLIFFLFAVPLCSLIGMKKEMMDAGALYLSSIGGGLVFLALKYATTSILSSQQKTGLNMLSTALMAASNLALNYVFVHGKLGFPELGAQGVALASCISWIISLAFSVYLIRYRLKIDVKFPATWARLKSFAKPVLAIAVPSVLEPVSWHMSQVAIIAVIVQMGEQTLATRVYANNILMLVAMYGTAMSAGVQIKVSRYVGARDFSSASREVFLGVKLGLAGSTALVALLYTFSAQIFGVFTQSADIAALGKNILLVAFVCEAGRILNLVVGASLKASGDAKFISFWGITVMWTVSVPLAWLFGIHFGWGLVGVWCALAVDELVRGMVASARWASRAWQTKIVYAVAA